MQADTASIVSPWVPVGLTILGIIVTVSIPIAGWAYKSTHKRIDELKSDMDTKITGVKDDAESKRIETRDTLLELVEAKFDAIWSTLKDIKDEVKGHH